MIRFMPEFYVFIFGIISGFIFRVYLFFLSSVLVLFMVAVFNLSDGRDLADVVWSSLVLVVIYQLSYFLGVIADALLKRE